MSSRLNAELQMAGQVVSGSESTTPSRLAFRPEQNTNFVLSLKRDDVSIVGLTIALILLFAITLVLRRRRARPKSSEKQP